MKTLSILIAGMAGAMVALTWGTTEAMAWAVALAGWVPHCFVDSEVAHGH